MCVGVNMHARQYWSVDNIEREMHPMISIVMPSFQQGQFIERSLSSALTQSTPCLEVIVQDGGSTDRTPQIVHRLALIDDRLKWSSQKDQGPAHALNMAFTKVRGDIIGWLNSDDIYSENAFKNVIQAFEQNPDWVMCYGHGEHIDKQEQIIDRYPTKEPHIGMEGFKTGCYICQPTVFFKTAMLTLIGDLNTKYQTAFDYEYWIRAFNAFPDRVGFIDAVLAQSRLHEDCITNKMRETVALEGLKLGRDHLGGAQVHWAITYLEELREETMGDDASFQSYGRSFIQKAQEFLSLQDRRAIMSALDIG